jgi:hypothetical protein
MQLSYEKLGLDDPMYGKAEYKVMDGMQPVCYKTADGYFPIVTAGQAAANAAKTEADKPAGKPEAQTLYVLSFKVNGEAEEMTFKSKKKLEKTLALYKEKSFMSDFETTEYQIVA